MRVDYLTFDGIVRALRAIRASSVFECRCCGDRYYVLVAGHPVPDSHRDIFRDMVCKPCVARTRLLSLLGTRCTSR